MNDELIACRDEEPRRSDGRGGEVRTIGDVLEELLAQYQTHYPDINITVFETTPVAA